MKQLKVDLENCYGIQELKKDFNFVFNKQNGDEVITNTFALYAPNGTMKTSFAKVFQKLQSGKPADKKDIQDHIFAKDGEYTIKIDNREITKEDIFVISSFENFYESSNLANLLIDDSLKEELQSILKIKSEFFAYLSNKSGYKKDIVGLETQLKKDFEIENFLPEINSHSFDTFHLNEDFSSAIYKNIFDKESIIIKPDFQNSIKEFTEEMENIYKEFSFLEPVNFSLGKIKKISDDLLKQNFFVKNNKIELTGIPSTNDLESEIIKIETAIEKTPALKKISKLLKATGGIALLEEIEKNPDIVPYLKPEKFSELRKKLWLSSIKENQSNFDVLKKEFTEFSAKNSSKSFKETTFYEVYEIFKKRFTIPFEMDIENKESSILAESPPKIIFKFKNKDTGKWIIPHERKKIEEDILSQGEKRALYLLNIIFEIEHFKKQLKTGDMEQKLFIIDDIADSFDYKNKYAIIEYLRDIAEYEMEKNGEKIKPFYSIILSHNFDFFRTVQDRILNNSNKRANSFILESDDGNISFIPAGSKNITNPFDKWKTELNNNLKSLISSIPFIRNLTEYKNGNKSKEYLQLTYLLHQKNEDKIDENQNILVKKTKEVYLGDLESIFKNILHKVEFRYSEEEKKETILDIIWRVSDSILEEEYSNEIFLENKIILAIAIRLSAEIFMWSKVTNKSAIKGNQTGKLYQRYKDEFKEEKETLKILDSVNIMTPENIHINSFMYEPILDMGINELKNLYKETKEL